MDKDIVISLKNISVIYRQHGSFFKKGADFYALKNISLDLYRGEILGVIGKNGAGKTTLLKVIAGIIKPDAGTIVNNGVSVSLLALQAGFDPELSGADNVILGGMLLGYSKAQVLAQLENIKSFSGLENFMQQPIKTYSSGMRTRLGFSLAMYMSSDVLLLDEVLSVGDKEFRAKAERAMVTKMSSLQQTVVFVSHSEQQVVRLCDRVLELSN